MAASLLLVILSVGALVHGGDVPDLPENRIVGGEEIEIAQAPWQVFLNLRGIMCGGSIIHPDWVLTAAHCTKEKKAFEITVRIGSKSSISGGMEYRVAKVVDHEKYSGKPHLNDISLLKTATRMLLSHPVRAVTLPAPGTQRPPVGTHLTTSGWGKMEDGSIPEMLRAVDTVVREFRECNFDVTDERTQICAWLPGKNSCRGDSGGPLVYGDVLVGLSSFGANETCSNYPSIYTYVPAYSDWIRKHTNV